MGSAGCRARRISFSFLFSFFFLLFRALALAHLRGVFFRVTQYLLARRFTLLRFGWLRRSRFAPGEIKFELSPWRLVTSLFLKSKSTRTCVARSAKYRHSCACVRACVCVCARARGGIFGKYEISHLCASRSLSVRQDFHITANITPSRSRSMNVFPFVDIIFI